MPLTYDDKVLALWVAFQNGILTGLAILIPLAAGTGIGLLLLHMGERGRGGARKLGWPFATVVGLAVMGWLADVVYIAQVVSPRIVGFALMGIGIVCLPVALYRARGMSATANAHGGWEAEGPFARALTIVGWCVVLLVLLKQYMNTVLPVNDIDSIMHYAFLSRLIGSGVSFDDVVLLRKMPIADTNRLINHLYALGYMVRGEGSMHLMNFAFLGTAILLVHNFCTRAFGLVPSWSPLPALVALNIFENLATGYSAKVDYGVALLEVALVFSIVLRRELPRWIPALLFGMCVAARVNSARVAVVAGLVLLIDVFHEHREAGVKTRAAWAAAAKLVGGTALAAIVIASPPYVLNAIIYGNPIFPFLNAFLGSYPHWYDYIVFREQRYDVTGILAPLKIFVQTCVARLWEFLPASDTIGRYGLGPVFLLAPLGFRKRRWVMVLYGAFVVGVLTWTVTSNTHRTILGMAFMAIPLVILAMQRLWRLKTAYYAIYAGVIAMAAFTLYLRIDLDFFPYFVGRQTAAQFYDQTVRLAPRSLTPGIAEAAKIKQMAREGNIMAVNVVLQAHPDLKRVTTVSVPAVDMQARLRQPGLGDVDRIVILRTIESPYLRQRYGDFAAQYLSPGTEIRPLNGRLEKWRFASIYQDVHYFINDAILASPPLILNLMVAESARILVTPSNLQGGRFRAIPGLRLAWSSDSLDVFALGGGPVAR